MIISIHEGSTCDRFGPEKGYAMLKRAGIDGIQFGMGHYLMPGKVVRAGGPSIMDEPLETIIEAVRPYKRLPTRPASWCLRCTRPSRCGWNTARISTAA